MKTITSNTTFDGKTINFDPKDFKGMQKLMQMADTFTEPAVGVNVDGERVLISVNHDNITVSTHQKNDWVREMIYWEDGTVEELYHK